MKGFALIFNIVRIFNDRLCDLVVIVSAYRSIDPGSIPRATRFYEK
jgi:hypothetical protein